MNDSGWLLSDLLRSVTRFASRRPWLTLVGVTLLAIASISLTIAHIEFKTDRSDLIDPHAAFQQRWIQYTKMFGEASDIVIVVEADAPSTIKQVIDALGTRMQAQPDVFRNVLYRIEPGNLTHKGLQYLSPEQLEMALHRLEHYRPVAQGNWSLIRLDSLCTRLRLQIEDGVKHGSPESVGPLLQHVTAFTDSLKRFFVNPNDFQNPWPDVVPVDPTMRAAASQVTYLLNDAGTMGFLKAFPAPEKNGGFAGPTKAINRARTLIADVSTQYPGVRIGLTGIPVLENDEMRKSQDDMMKASLISFVGVAVVLCLGFRGVRHPLLALIMLAIGMAWAFGYTTLSVGHLNILSVSFAAILIGLGIDFGIHYLARYLELRHEGYSLGPALVRTSATVGTGIIAAAVTTSLAFFCALFTEFRGVAELGVIAGGGVLLCAIATFVALPALVAIADSRVEPRRLPTPFTGGWLRLLTSRHPGFVFIGSATLIAVVGMRAISLETGTPRLDLSYDHNLLNLQAEGLEAVEVQKRIAEDPAASLLFAVSVADTPEQARELRHRFEKLKTVHHVEELASRLPDEPYNKTLLLIQGIAAELAWLTTESPTFDTLNPADIGRSLEKLGQTIAAIGNDDATRTARGIDEFLDLFASNDFSLQEQVARLNEYQHRMAFALLAQFRELVAAANAEPVGVADLPEELTSRFVSPQGKWLVQIYPAKPIWDFEPLREFVEDLRTVDPNVTGTPLQNYEASQQIMSSYESAALYALITISLVLLADFLRRNHALVAFLLPLLLLPAVQWGCRHWQIHATPLLYLAAYLQMVAAIALVLDSRSFCNIILALLPPLIGGLLMFGILAALDVSLNPANLIVLPLILGIGVDDGVHVIHDYRTQRRRYRMSPSTMNAIVLTSLTSMIGFGSMMMAAHRGLYSLGLVLVVGVGSCLFVSLVTLPAILTLVANRTGRRTSKPTPVPKPHLDHVRTQHEATLPTIR